MACLLNEGGCRLLLQAARRQTAAGSGPCAAGLRAGPVSRCGGAGACGQAEGLLLGAAAAALRGTPLRLGVLLAQLLRI